MTLLLLLFIVTLFPGNWRLTLIHSSALNKVRMAAQSTSYIFNAIDRSSHNNSSQTKANKIDKLVVNTASTTRNQSERCSLMKETSKSYMLVCASIRSLIITPASSQTTPSNITESCANANEYRCSGESERWRHLGASGDWWVAFLNWARSNHIMDTVFFYAELNLPTLSVRAWNMHLCAASGVEVHVVWGCVEFQLHNNQGLLLEATAVV